MKLLFLQLLFYNLQFLLYCRPIYLKEILVKFDMIEQNSLFLESKQLFYALRLKFYYSIPTFVQIGNLFFPVGDFGIRSSQIWNLLLYLIYRPSVSAFFFRLLDFLNLFSCDFIYPFLEIYIYIPNT